MKSVPLTLFYNGKLWSASEDLSWADSLLVAEGWIVAVGARSDFSPPAGVAWREVDLDGGFVVPGFNDAHLHLMEGGKSLCEIDLRDTRSLDEALERVRRFVETLRDDAWVTGGNWDHEAWTEPRLPTRHDLDRVCGPHPALLYRKDGHVAVANSVALQKAGVSSQTANPPGGEIDRDERGEPTGVLRDRAIELVEEAIPEPHGATLRTYALKAQGYALARGVCSVQGPFSAREFQVLQELRREGRLKLRVNVWTPLEQMGSLISSGVAVGLGDAWLRLGTIKIFADGSLGAGTAYFREAYQDRPDTRGLLIHEPSELGEFFRTAQEGGLQLAVHAIGDAAVQIVLDQFERVGASRLRHRIEHAQSVTDSDLSRFAKQGIVASVQPVHLTSDLLWARRKIGDRVRISYRVKSFLRAGCAVTFGTDWPVEDLDPRKTLAAAVFRRPLSAGVDWDPEDWSPEERVGMDEALRCYTSGSAYAEHQERVKGELRPGMLADFVVFDRDLREAKDADDVLNAHVRMTVVGGEIAYRED